MHVPAFFRSNMQDVDSINDLDLDAVVSDFDQQIDNFNSRGSGFVLEQLTQCVVCITKFRPFSGSDSTFVPTPTWFANKRCTVNVKCNDNKCFLWSVLFALYPAKDNVSKICNYRPYENSLNTTDLQFPMRIKDIGKFEQLNENISVNVLCVDDKREYYPLYAVSYTHLTLPTNREV